MILYDKNKDRLDVYDLLEKKDELLKYRISEIEKIPLAERVYFAESRITKENELPLFEYYTGRDFNKMILDSSYADNITPKNYNEAYHVLKPDLRSKRNNDFLLECYQFGHLKNGSLVQINYLEKLKYFLVTEKRYDFLGEYIGGKNYKMDKIIQLTKNLFLLQLLEQEKFKYLSNFDISNIISFYNLSKINEIDLNEVKKLDECEITDNVYSKIISKSENDKYILKLIKN